MTGWAGTVFRNVTVLTSVYRLNRLAILPGIVTVQILPVPILMVVNDFGKIIDFEFLIFR